MASPARLTTKHMAAGPPPIELLSDDLLAEILLRLPTLSDVGRAATSCTAFRRVAADRAFLHCLRSVHPSPLLGLIFLLMYPMRPLARPVELPHSSSPYSRAFAERADRSFSFLPSDGTWIPVDARDGRVLLQSGRCSFMVCDPLSRRYALLPEIPGDLASHCRHSIEPFLVPASDEEMDTSFRVVCPLEDFAANQMVAFVFSSTTGQWRSLAMDAGVQPSPRVTSTRGYAYSCFYWKVHETDKLIVFDTRTLEFTSVHIPFNPDPQQQDHVIVEAREGKLGVFILNNSIISAVSHLIYAIQEIDEDGSSRWRIERRVRLPSPNNFSFQDATDRFLLLRGSPWKPHLGSTVRGEGAQFFSFEFESMKIEKICGLRSGNNILYAKLYVGFPPSLCLPSI